MAILPALCVWCRDSAACNCFFVQKPAVLEQDFTNMLFSKTLFALI